jgi:hypothetical protein
MLIYSFDLIIYKDEVKVWKFVDWQQCAAVMQRKAVTIMPNCSGGGDVVVA